MDYRLESVGFMCLLFFCFLFFFLFSFVDDNKGSMERGCFIHLLKRGRVSDSGGE